MYLAASGTFFFSLAQETGLIAVVGVLGPAYNKLQLSVRGSIR
jgi:hypothetical protein